LRTADIVVMDNLSSHKGKATRQMIEAAGASLLYLLRRRRLRSNMIGNCF